MSCLLSYGFAHPFRGVVFLDVRYARPFPFQVVVVESGRSACVCPLIIFPCPFRRLGVLEVLEFEDVPFPVSWFSIGYRAQHRFVIVVKSFNLQDQRSNPAVTFVVQLGTLATSNPQLAQTHGERLGSNLRIAFVRVT